MGLPREPSKHFESDSDVQTEDSGKQEGKPEVRTSNRLTRTAVQATVMCSNVFKDVCSSEPQRCLTSYRGQLQKQSLARQVEQLRSEPRIMRLRMKSPTNQKGHTSVHCTGPISMRYPRRDMRRTGDFSTLTFKSTGPRAGDW